MILDVDGMSNFIPKQVGSEQKVKVLPSTAMFNSSQPPRGDPWKLSSQLKQMSTPRECFRGGKRKNSRPWKRKIPDANISATVPSVLQRNIEGYQLNFVLNT